MPSHSLAPPFQLQSILKQTHINKQGEPQPCKKRKKPTQRLSFSGSSASAPSPPGGKESLSTSHSRRQRDVMVLVRLYPDLLLHRHRASQHNGRPGAAMQVEPPPPPPPWDCGAEPSLGTYEELLLAFGVPFQDGLQQLGRLARQGCRQGCGVAAPSMLQLSGTVPRGGSQASAARVTAWERLSLT